MSSRDAILSRIRAQHRSVPLTDFQFTTVSANPAKEFSEVLKNVGGFCFPIPDRDALATQLRDLDVYKNANDILSLVPPVTGNIDINKLSDPHQLSGVDLAILPGVFGVAENAAIWLDKNCLGPHRAVFVIPQHLVLVVNADQIVATMHDAYARITLNDHDFGLFISGPSKTADIEQSLVIGAHGARSCTVFLVG